jgi:type IV pilus assembly protein PilQ
MRKYSKTAGLLFLAAAAVYTNQATSLTSGTSATPATASAGPRPGAAPAAADGFGYQLALAAPAADATGTDIKLLDESAPAAAADAAAGGETDPFADAATQPTSQPAEGQKLSESEVDVNDEGTVEIHVNDASLIEVLRMLSLQTQKNILPSKDVRGTVTANLYDVTVREALDAILHANGYAYREKGNFIYVYTTKELQELEKAELRMTTRVFRLAYTPAANAQNLVKPVLSAQGQVALTTPAKTGIESGSAEAGGDDHAEADVLVITDYPENLERVAKILQEIDVRPAQILLEAVILRATLDEDNVFGVDFNVLSGVDFTDVLTGNGGQFNNAVIEEGTAVDSRASSVGTGNNFTNNVGGLKVGFVSDNVAVFLSALEQTTDTTIMANPKILTLNKQKGEVFVGNEDGYYTTITTETTTSQSVETLKTGTRLIFRPYIASDGYIRMEVHPEDSAGSVKANGLPSKTTTEVTSNIMVRDGHTIVIGGLFRESSSTTRSQIPVLGNLPLVGAAFRKQQDKTVREEVIVLLTPHIIKDDAAYAALSEEQLHMAEQLRVGTRKGMMFWGRERLAQMWYDAALKELDERNPDRKLAKWYLDSATNLNPTFSEAIALKEQLTGYEVTTSNGSSVRNFVSQAMLHDTAPAVAPATTRPAAQAAAPATQPSGGSMSMKAYVKDVAGPAATRPSTQPVADAAGEVAEEVEVVDAEPMAVAEEPAMVEEAVVAEVPSTQPVADGEGQPVEVMEVTELPLEDAIEAPAGEGSASDGIHFGGSK